MNRYPIAPDQWMHTPIVRATNPLTQLIEGDDSGYRKVKTLLQNDSPLVVPNVLCRSSYDGVTEFGVKDPSIMLSGGLPGGKLVVRETFARDIEDANNFLQKAFGNAFSLCALDGFRSCERQAAGFSRMLRLHMGKTGLNSTNVNDRIGSFIDAGNAADGTFSWVNADISAPVYVQLANGLRKDEHFWEQISAYARSKSQGKAVTEDDIDELIYTYVTISANSGIGLAAGRKIPLVFENNAHAGGGACDIFLVDGKGLPLNHIPFDYPGEEAGMSYLENDENYDRFKVKAITDPAISDHLNLRGISADTFSRKNWEWFRSAIRVLYHLTRAKGWTYYSSDHGGENWHLEGGNRRYDILTGDVIASEALTGETYPDSGNPGHTLQLLGRDDVAVWGGGSGHEQARKLGLVM